MRKIYSLFLLRDLILALHVKREHYDRIYQRIAKSASRLSQSECFKVLDTTCQESKRE